MKKTIILNHKMNLEYDEIYNYIKKINEVDNQNLIICPSNIYLEAFVNNCNWAIASQNVCELEMGDYTGEISTTQLKSLGIDYSIIGHSERKKYYKENNKLINKKLNACIDTNIIPILCFGDKGTKENIKKDLDELLKGIKHINFIVFAYEPLDIEGTIPINDIEDNINYIYNYLYTKYKVSPNLVYGGGIDKNNIGDILKIDKLNGIMIGSISKDIDKILDIINIID